MLQWMLETSLIGGVLALGVAIFCRFNQHKPSLCHILWVLVLVRLLLPPLPLPTLSYKLDPVVDRLESGIVGQSAQQTSPDMAEIEENEGPIETTANTESEDTFEEGIWAGADGPVLTGAVTSSSTNLIPMRHGLLALWGLGSFLILIVQFRRMNQFNRVLELTASPSQTLMHEVSSVAQHMAVKAPQIMVLSQITSPMVWSFGKPVLLWPAKMKTIDAIPGARSILAHELAHLKRLDHWTRWLEYLGMGLLWWHPLFWVVRNRIRYYSELACDAWAVWAFPKQRRAYAGALIDAVAPAPTNPSPVAALAATNSERRYFERRLTMIMRRRTTPKIPPLWLIIALVLIVPLLPSLSKNNLANQVTMQATGNADMDEIIEARVLVRQAKSHYKAENWADAVDAYQQLADLRPDDYKAHWYLGEALMASDRASEAVSVFRKLTELEPHKPHAWFHLAKAQAQSNPGSAMRSLEAAVKRGYMDSEEMMDSAFEAISERSGFMDLVKTSLTAHKLKKEAEEAFGDDDWDTVLANYNQILEMMPDYAHAYTRLVFGQIRNGYLDDAEQTLKKQMDMEYRVPVAQYNMACIHALNGDTSRALEFLKKAVDANAVGQKHLETDSDLDALRDLQGYQDIVAGMEERQNAFKQVKMALKEGNEDALARARTLMEEMGDEHGAYKINDAIGLTMLKKGDYAAAEEAFKAMVLAEHDVSRALYNLACVYARQGKVDKAFDYLQNAVATGFDNLSHISSDSDLDNLREDARFEEFMKGLANAKELSQFNINSWNELETRSRAAIEKDAGNGKAYHHLGWSLLRQNDYTGAIDAFQNQAINGYREATARYNIACTLAKKGDRDEALGALEKAIAAGFDNGKLMATDSDLASLRDDSRFETMLIMLKKRHAHDHDGDHDHDYKERHKHED